jgi:hypothetical protein
MLDRIGTEVLAPRTDEMSLSEIVLRHLQAKYVEPARMQGVEEIAVQAGEIHRDLKWTSRVPAVCAALNSRKLQRAAGLELIEKSGPPSGQSTTMVFRYRVLPQAGVDLAAKSPTGERPQGGLLALYGICADMYREVGGAEAFLRSQREDFGSIVAEDSEPESDAAQEKIA